jgi:hypothetical protein
MSALASGSLQRPVHATDFQTIYSGMLYGVLDWRQLDALWARVAPDAGWYLYAVGETPPVETTNGDAVSAFLREIDALLRRDHHEDYCGIVYADDLAQPRLIKIYDPNHLGSSCGSIGYSVPPGWVMSLMPPAEIQAVGVIPANRKRWWQALLGG